jgi:iron complex outermembrane receptor protein
MRINRFAPLYSGAGPSLAAILASLVWPACPARAADNATETANDSGLEEVVVSARKREETLMNVPESITAFSEATLEKLDIRSFADYATKTPNLSFSYGTANWGFVDSHTVAIRGISGFGTTGVYIDDTPVPDSLDPRVIDIQRIEILKGPQGTLFGQGSLGGNLRLVTVQPSADNPDVHYSVRAGDTSGAGTADYGADFAGSHILGNDDLIVRAVGFYDHEGGFLHRVATDPNTGVQTASVNNYGANRSYGGSVSLRWIISQSFEAGLRIMAQETDWDGWQAPYAPNPPFEIQSFTMDRTNDVQENARDRFYLPALTLQYSGNGYSIHESLSYFDRRTTQVEDGSEGTRDALSADWSAFFPDINQLYTDNTAFPWTQIVNYRRTVSETRISFDKTSFGLSGVGGVYLSRSYSNTELNSPTIPLIQSLGLNTNEAVGASYCRTTITDTSCPTYGSGLGWTSQQPSFHHDIAAFGEAYYDFSNFELTVGGRLYRQTQSGSELAAGALNFAYLNLAVPDTKQAGFNPKLALKYQFNPEAMMYASFSKGFRAGGAGVPLPLGPASFFTAIHQTANTPTTYTSDTVKNYEIGGKIEGFDGKVSLTAAVFQMDWANIQQTIIAPESYITLIVNAGDARVRGGELELEARPIPSLELHAGVGYEDAKITDGQLYWQPTGSRVYQVPKITSSASARFSVPVTSTLSSYVSVDGSYTGNSQSGTMGCQLNVGPGVLPEFPTGTQFFPCPTVGGSLQGVAPTRAGYKILNAQLGIEWGQSQLSLYGANLTNSRPNLGDFNPESYAKHDPETGFIIPRVATLRPISFGLQFRQRF